MSPEHMLSNGATLAQVMAALVRACTTLHVPSNVAHNGTSPTINPRNK